MGKEITLMRNEAGGIDLITERDSGNRIRILTGNRQHSRAFWERLDSAAVEALYKMEEGEV